MGVLAPALTRTDLCGGVGGGRGGAGAGVAGGPALSGGE